MLAPICFWLTDLCPINRPSRSPISNSLNSANKSIRPLLTGVPVSPHYPFQLRTVFHKSLEPLRPVVLERRKLVNYRHIEIEG